MKRKVTTVYAPHAQPGFLGKGHTARPVIGVDFEQSDPFIMLMDDRLEKTDYSPVGGPHPHAGFETVTLVLAGEIGEGEQGLKSGDLEMMTAGRGIVHTETISQPASMHILQLWLNLPKHERQAQPRVQHLSATHVPFKLEDGVVVRVYSGTFAGLTSPLKNHTPLILAELTMNANTKIETNLPSDFSSFIYVIEGSAEVGSDNKLVTKDQVGWLNRSDVPGEGELQITTGKDGARLVIYAAQPQHHEIVSHGPFIADSMDDIRQLYSDYRSGRMGHIHDVPQEHQFVY
ncbi:MAG TPA: pirin-like C-terminal cupin domain-containing protein [Chryseolinea sp.]|nr:pirin-like C-terminal cupin domain-containing protein [Chryseolinea sp.]